VRGLGESRGLERECAYVGAKFVEENVVFLMILLEQLIRFLCSLRTQSLDKVLRLLGSFEVNVGCGCHGS